jgi:hypothetical protein
VNSWSASSVDPRSHGRSYLFYRQVQASGAIFRLPLGVRGILGPDAKDAEVAVVVAEEGVIPRLSPDGPSRSPSCSKQIGYQMARVVFPRYLIIHAKPRMSTSEFSSGGVEKAKAHQAAPIRRLHTRCPVTMPSSRATCGSRSASSLRNNGVIVVVERVRPSSGRAPSRRHRRGSSRAVRTSVVGSSQRATPEPLRTLPSSGRTTGLAPAPKAFSDSR